MPRGRGAPTLPFEGYKWRWASLQPTESLNVPAVFLGVLRALHDCEGLRPNSQGVLERFKELERALGPALPSRLVLARVPRRNLLRNSGQYWTGLGLLDDHREGIRLSALGKAVATGRVSLSEFAAQTILNLTLPNERIQSDAKLWHEAGVSIRPLLLVLQVLWHLSNEHGAGWISDWELVRVLIPLAPSRESRDIARAISLARLGQIEVKDWPDCAPLANDPRMAREFLLFLAHHGFLVPETPKGGHRVFRLAETSLGAVQRLASAPPDAGTETNEEYDQILGELVTAQRRRVTVTAWARPGQADFRKRVLAAFGSRCILSRESVPEALDAAHIRPVEYSGTDERSNGLCLRSDLHALFDAALIRVRPDGGVFLADRLRQSPGYSSLPSRVALPRHVSEEALRWRWEFM